MSGGADAGRGEDAGADGASGDALRHFSGADEAQRVGVGGDRNDIHFRLCFVFFLAAKNEECVVMLLLFEFQLERGSEGVEWE